MKVDTQLLEKWNQLYDFGDKKKICEFTGVSYPMILKALKGSANEDLIVKIDEFFTSKQDRLTKNLIK